MDEQIENKVAGSGLITLDLENFLPGKILVFDLKEYLFMGLILKEKDFRESLKNFDWSVYQATNVAIDCTADAIIPVWAYMLVVSYLEPVAKEIYTGTIAEMQKHLFLKNITALDVSSFKDQRMVIKGCGDIAIGEFAYAEITKKLRPVARSIMYGEPCSTVPVFKKQKGI